MARLIAVFVILVVLASRLCSVSAAIAYEAVGDSSYPPLVYVNDQNLQDGYDAAVILLFIVVAVVGSGLIFIYSLRNKVMQATAQLSEANRLLTEAYDVTIRAFYKMLEHRESGTAEHSMAVNEIALAIGKQMRLSSEEMLYLNWGTLLHDIGKLAISNEILLKREALLPNEYAIIQQHAQVGYEILNNTEYLRKVGEVARHHHERYDGQGYPCGLRGEEIPLLARICTVADSFEAIIADRPYQLGRHYQEALAEIINNSGSQFDPQVVAAFICLEHSQFAKSSVGTIFQS
jgi:putative nucleotidyltransferase with HDIG domain